MNKNQVEFSVFCIENVAERLGITGDETYKLLTKESHIFSFIIPELIRK